MTEEDEFAASKVVPITRVLVWYRKPGNTVRHVDVEHYERREFTNEYGVTKVLEDRLLYRTRMVYHHSEVTELYEVYEKE